MLCSMFKGGASVSTICERAGRAAAEPAEQRAAEPTEQRRCRNVPQQDYRTLSREPLALSDVSVIFWIFMPFF